MESLDLVARDVLQEHQLSFKPFFALEVMHCLLEGLLLWVFALFIFAGTSRFECATFWILASLWLSVYLRAFCNVIYFGCTNGKKDWISYTAYWKRNVGNSQAQSICTLIASRSFFGVAKVFQKVWQDGVNSSIALLLFSFAPFAALFFGVLVFLEAIFGLVVFLVLIFPGQPLAHCWSRATGVQLPQWYQRYIYLWRLLATEHITQSKELVYLFLGKPSSSSNGLVTVIYRSAVACYTGYFLNYFQFAIGALLLSRFEEITDTQGLDSFYESLRSGDLSGGGIRHIIVQPPSKENHLRCLRDCESGGLKLNKEKLEGLRAAGLRFYAVGYPYRKKSLLSWCQATLSPTEFVTSEMLFFALQRRTLFVSHRWDSTGTWHGRGSWQLAEVFRYMSSDAVQKEGGLDYFW